MARSDDFVARAIRGAGWLILWGGFIGAALTVGAQIYLFLKSGEWIEQGTLDMLGGLLNWQWAITPTDWLGLHRTINALNSGFSLAIVGSALGLAMISFEAE